MKSRNGYISETLSPMFDKVLTKKLPGYAFSSSMFCHAGIDELGDDTGETTCLYWVEPHDDVGTYQFFITDGQLVVADYFDKNYVYGTYSNAQEFDAQYDLGADYSLIMIMIEMLSDHKAYAYLSLDSEYIDHRELMSRSGWNDRRIKKHFPNVQLCEIDHVKYYPLNQVLAIEKTID